MDRVGHWGKINGFTLIFKKYKCSSYKLMKTYDLDLHLFNQVNKPYLTFCQAICAPCKLLFKPCYVTLGKDNISSKLYFPFPPPSLSPSPFLTSSTSD